MLEITCTIRYAYTATCLCMDFSFFLLDISYLGFWIFSVCIRLGFWSIFFFFLFPFIFFLYPPISLSRLARQTIFFFSTSSRCPISNIRYIRKIGLCIFFFIYLFYIRDWRERRLFFTLNLDVCMSERNLRFYIYLGGEVSANVIMSGRDVGKGRRENPGHSAAPHDREWQSGWLNRHL